MTGYRSPPSWMCERCGAVVVLDIHGGPPPAPTQSVWSDLSGDVACTPGDDGAPRGHRGVPA